MESDLVYDPFIGCSEDQLLAENWLTKGTTTVNYKCRNCESIHQIDVSRRVPDQVLKAHTIFCDCQDNTSCTYNGTEPRKIGLMTKTTFEKNGRIGIKTNFSNGKSSVRSMTKENTMNGKGHSSVLTPAFQEKVNKDKLKAVIYKEKQLGNELKKQSALRRKK